MPSQNQWILGSKMRAWVGYDCRQTIWCPSLFSCHAYKEERFSWFDLAFQSRHRVNNMWNVPARSNENCLLGVTMSWHRWMQGPPTGSSLWFFSYSFRKLAVAICLRRLPLAWWFWPIEWCHVYPLFPLSKPCRIKTSTTSCSCVSQSFYLIWESLRFG